MAELEEGICTGAACPKSMSATTRRHSSMQDGSGANKIRPSPVGLHPHVGAGVRSIDHLAVADVDADVGHVAGASSEEQQIAGPQRVVGQEPCGGVVLVLSNPGQGDAGNLVGSLDEPGAVEANTLGLAAPYIRGADLGERPVDGDPRRSTDGECLRLGLAVGLGKVQYLSRRKLAEWS